MIHILIIDILKVNAILILIVNATGIERIAFTIRIHKSQKTLKISLTKFGTYYYNNVYFMSGGGKMKRTYQPNKRRRAKKHGFFARKNSNGNILNNRRRKGRKELVK